MHFAGETTYIACPILPHFLSGIPIVLVPSSGVTTFTYNGREGSIYDYEVLTCSEPEILYWKEHCTEVPKHAIRSRHGVSIGRTCTPLEAGVHSHGSKSLQPSPGFQGPLVGRISYPTYYPLADSIHQLVLKPCSNTAAYGSFQLMCSNSQDTLKIGCTSLYTM